jgi:glutamine synthetase
VSDALTLPGTVALAVPDAHGRLIGKRLTWDSWERVEAEGTFPMPDFHLITDAANEPVPGMAAAGVHRGFGNGLLRPDPATMRPLAWHDGTVLVLCDALDAGGLPCETAPRWILRRQLLRLAAADLAAGCASELEFYAYRTSYEDLARTGHGVPTPAFHRAGDNDLLIDGYLEPLLGAVRKLMPESGIPVELSREREGSGSSRWRCATPTRSRWPTGTSSTSSASRRSRSGSAWP